MRSYVCHQHKGRGVGNGKEGEKKMSPYGSAQGHDTNQASRRWSILNLSSGNQTVENQSCIDQPESFLTYWYLWNTLGSRDIVSKMFQTMGQNPTPSGAFNWSRVLGLCLKNVLNPWHGPHTLRFIEMHWDPRTLSQICTETHDRVTCPPVL